MNIGDYIEEIDIELDERVPEPAPGPAPAPARVDPGTLMEKEPVA